ncbi:MAG: hypothetical protein C0605_10015 [Hyphomicrobiales bacterium]|nr:MAG: hypothetical protein C0605_10015 [Hyphomicrobiales bacterium]
MKLNFAAAGRLAGTAAAALLLAGTLTAGAATEPGANNWIKQCTKNKAGHKICLTATNLFISKPTRQRLVGVAVRTEEKQKVKALLVVLPLGIYITPGFTVKLDEGEGYKGQVVTCRRDGCHAQFTLGDGMYKELRKAKNLNLIYIDHKRQKLNVAVPMAGFAEAFEGPAAKLPPPPMPKKAK